MPNENTQNLGGVDLDQFDLVTLKKLAEAASENFERRKRSELKTMVTNWLAEAGAVGYSIQDVLAEVRTRMPGQGATATAASGKGSRGPRSDKGKTAAPKYRGPNGELWSGRGQPPNWMKPLLATGKTKEDFLIAKA